MRLAFSAVMLMTAIFGTISNKGAQAADLSPKPSCYTVSVTGQADIRCYIIGPGGTVYNWSGNSSGRWWWTEIGRNALNNSRSLSCLRTHDGVNHCFYVATERIPLGPPPFGALWRELGGLRWLRFSDGGAVTSTDLGDPGHLPGFPLPLQLRNVNFIGNELSCAERGRNAIICFIRTSPFADVPRKLFKIEMALGAGVWSLSSSWSQLGRSGFGDDLSDWHLADCTSDPAVVDQCVFYKPSMIAGFSVSQMFPLVIYRSHPVYAPGTGPVWMSDSLINGPGAPPDGRPTPGFDAQITGGPRCFFVKREEVGFPGGYRPFPWCFAIASMTRPGSVATVASLFGYNRISRNWTAFNIVPVEIGTSGFPTPEPDYEFQPACVALTRGTASSPPRGGCFLVGTDGLLDVRVFNGATPSSLSIGLGDVLGGPGVRGGITGPPTCVSTTDPANTAHAGGRMDCFFRNGRYYLERITLSFNSKGTLVNFPREELWTEGYPPGRFRMDW